MTPCLRCVNKKGAAGRSYEINTELSSFINESAYFLKSGNYIHMSNPDYLLVPPQASFILQIKSAGDVKKLAVS